MADIARTKLPDSLGTSRASRRRARRGDTFLLIDLCDSTLALAELGIGRGASTMSPTAMCELPDGLLDAGRESDSAQWLSQQFAQRGITARRAVLLIPRSRVSFRALETPRVPDDELIPLIELQAETQSLTPFSELQWSYVRGAEANEESPLHPLLMTMPRRRLEPLARVIALAGLEMEAVMPRSVALAASAATAHASQNPSSDVWVVAQAGEEIEIVLANGRGELVASQSVRHRAEEGTQESPDSVTLPATQAVVSRLNQCVAALPERIGRRAEAICHLSVPDKDAAAMRDALVRDAGFTPANITVAPRGAFERAAAGCLLLLESTRPLPDLSRPPRVAPPAPRRWGLAAGLAAALLVAIGWSVHSSQARMDRQLEQLRGEERRLSKLSERGESVEALSAQLEQWSARQVDARNELAEFLSRLPDSGDVVLTEIALSAASDGCVHLRAQGASTSSETALKLNERMLAAPSRYELQPHPLRKSRRNDTFPVAFEIEAEVEHENEPGEEEHLIEPVSTRN